MKVGQGKAQPDSTLYLKCVFQGSRRGANPPSDRLPWDPGTAQEMGPQGLEGLSRGWFWRGRVPSGDLVEMDSPPEKRRDAELTATRVCTVTAEWPYRFAGQSKLVLSTCCRAGTRERQARHPGDRTHGGPVLGVHPALARACDKGPPAILRPGSPACLTPVPPLTCCVPIPHLVGGVSCLSLPQVSPWGTVLFPHTLPYPFLCPVLSFLTSVLFREILPLRGLSISSLTHPGPLTSHLRPSHPKHL